MECWNDGIMVSGKTQCSNIPLFQFFSRVEELYDYLI
jgi:hypothetical protein